MNVFLSDILSEVLEPVAENIGANEVCSSEDLLNTIDQVNKKLEALKNTKESEEIVLLAADAEALYPSLKRDTCAKICAEEIQNSSLDFQDINWKEMTRYLYLNMTESVQKQWKVDRWIPRRDTGGEPSKLTMLSKQMLGPKPPEEQ